MSASKLFQPTTFNGHALNHRVVLGSVTRAKANENQEPDADTVQFYAQRSRVPGTLVFTEGIHISVEATGSPTAPGIYTPGQIAAWKKVTDAVHDNGSFIYIQLTAEGRTADPAHLAKSGNVVVSSGGMPIAGGANPKPLPLAWIERYKAAYVKAAQNALEAGFDGIEISAHNGSLLDSFLQTVTNNRTDDYGGDIHRRARFPLEVVGAVTAVVGQEKVGVKISPFSEYQGMSFGEDIPTFSYFVTQLEERFPSLGHLAVQEPGLDGHETATKVAPKNATESLSKIWGNTRPYITSGAYTSEGGKAAADENPTWLVSYDRLFTVNPDLPGRMYFNTPPLEAFDSEKFFGSGYLTGTFETNPLKTFPHVYSSTPMKQVEAAAAPATPAPAEKPAAKSTPAKKANRSSSAPTKAPVEKTIDEKKPKKTSGFKVFLKKIVA